MMRFQAPEPAPRTVALARWLSLTSWGLAVLSLVAVRFGGIPPLNGLAVLGLAILLAVLAIVAVFVALAGIWHSGAPGTGKAMRSLLLAVALLVWPGWMAATAMQLPAVNDVTTSAEDPPTFLRSRTALDARGGWVPPAYESRNSALQKEAYGDLQTITIEQSSEDVMALVRRAVTNLRWVIVDSVNPGGRVDIGRIDAVATSFLYRFPDDISIRVRPGAGDVRVDIRSVSRFGRHDFGSNAAHIRQLTRELEVLATGR